MRASRIFAVLCITVVTSLVSRADDWRDELFKHNKNKKAKSADVELLRSYVPRPYLSVGPALMPDGYAVLAAQAVVGLTIESPRLVFDGFAGYDNGHKVNDNNQPNPSGHDRYLRGMAYARFHENWLVGAGWRWNELSTSNYRKSGSRPQIGGAYDWFSRECERCRRDFSMRIEARWLFRGTDWQNGSTGIEYRMTLPSPREKAHWFFSTGATIFRFYDTVTDRNNTVLTQEQMSQRHTTSTVDFMVTYRF